MNEEQKLIKTFFYPIADNKESMELKNDAAVLFKKKKMIITSDMMIEDVHFDNSYNPEILARKLLRINLSDVAAMGASPYGYTLNVAIPKRNRVRWLEKFSHGLNLDGKKFGIKLFGGDLSVSSKIFLSATFLGVVGNKFHKNFHVIKDSEIYVGGNIGDAAIGLSILNKKISLKDKSYFLNKLFLPDPQISLGKSLIGIVDFCTDISDGLLTELETIANNSNLKANIFESEIPLSIQARKLLKKSGLKKKVLELILTGGEDYKLLFSVRNSKKKYLKDNIKNIKKIGFFSSGTGVEIYDQNKKKINFKKKGFCHF